MHRRPEVLDGQGQEIYDKIDTTESLEKLLEICKDCVGRVGEHEHRVVQRLVEQMNMCVISNYDYKKELLILCRRAEFLAGATTNLISAALLQKALEISHIYIQEYNRDRNLETQTKTRQTGQSQETDSENTNAQELQKVVAFFLADVKKTKSIDDLKRCSSDALDALDSIRLTQGVNTSFDALDIFFSKILILENVSELRSLERQLEHGELRSALEEKMDIYARTEKKDQLLYTLRICFEKELSSIVSSLEIIDYAKKNLLFHYLYYKENLWLEICKTSAVQKYVTEECENANNSVFSPKHALVWAIREIAEGPKWFDY
jgi:hypothetical protein